MSASPIVKRVVEQHAAEAAFLWTLRDAATDESHYTLRHLAALEERLDAHLDALLIAGTAGREIAWARLERVRGATELFPVATIALESRTETEIERMLQLAETVPESRRGLFGALGWVS